MRHFYFDVLDGDSFTRDDEGLDLPDLNAAEVMAIQAAAEISHESLPKRLSSEICVRVRDEQGEPVLPVAVAMTVRRKMCADASGTAMTTNLSSTDNALKTQTKDAEERERA